jgi:hypothetical protein
MLPSRLVTRGGTTYEMDTGHAHERFIWVPTKRRNMTKGQAAMVGGTNGLPTA